MRGVLSAGGLVALADLGLTDIFDEIYATSAGAMNASYFLSHQARQGITIYYQDMVKRQALSLWRPWRILDLDWIFDHVVGGEKALHTDALLASRTKLFVSLLDATTGEPVLLDIQKTSAPVVTVLKACTAVPVAYNRSILVEGRPCVDAGVASPFPLKEALASACTDLLVLLTRPPAFRGERPGRTSDLLYNLLFAGGNMALRKAYAGQPARDAELRALAVAGAPDRPDVNVATLCSEGVDVIHRLTKDPVRLRAAGLSFGRALLKALDADTDTWTLPAVS
jgi:predicted acylesterase/phospholipase RssA